MAGDDEFSIELANLAEREAMLRRGAKRLLDEADRLKERQRRIERQAQRMKEGQHLHRP